VSIRQAAPEKAPEQSRLPRPRFKEQGVRHASPDAPQCEHDHDDVVERPNDGQEFRDQINRR